MQATVAQYAPSGYYIASGGKHAGRQISVHMLKFIIHLACVNLVCYGQEEGRGIRHEIALYSISQLSVCNIGIEKLGGSGDKGNCPRPFEANILPSTIIVAYYLYNNIMLLYTNCQTYLVRSGSGTRLRRSISLSMSTSRSPGRSRTLPGLPTAKGLPSVEREGKS